MIWHKDNISQKSEIFVFFVCIKGGNSCMLWQLGDLLIERWRKIRRKDSRQAFFSRNGNMSAYEEIRVPAVGEGKMFGSMIAHASIWWLIAAAIKGSAPGGNSSCQVTEYESCYLHSRNIILIAHRVIGPLIVILPLQDIPQRVTTDDTHSVLVYWSSLAICKVLLSGHTHFHMGLLQSVQGLRFTISASFFSCQASLMTFRVSLLSYIECR